MTADSKSIVLISKDARQISDIGSALGAQQRYTYEEQSGTLTEMNGRASQLAQDHDLILFQTEDDTEKDVTAIKALREGKGRKAVILALSDADTTLADAQRLTRAGVDGVLAETISSAELEEEIQRRLRPASRLTLAMPENSEMGKVITVAQSRGGIGATTLAVNLADHLTGVKSRRKKTPQNRVALVDLDLQFGAVSGFLDVKPNEALYQLAIDGTDPDATFLSQSMVTLQSGLSVLAAPAQMAPLEALNPQQVKRLLETLQHDYDYVIVDLPRALVEWLAPVLDATDRMFIVTDSTVPAIQNTRRLIDVYTEDNIGLQIDIVVNHEKKPLMQARHHVEAAKALERPLKYWLPPQAKAAREAVDRGVPLSEAAGSSSLNKAIKRIAEATKAELAQNQKSAEQVQ